MDIKKNLSAAILVGRSTRMGRDKAMLTLDKQTFIGHLARELSGCHEVFISSVFDSDYSDYGLRMFVDEYPHVGPMEGIRQSLRHADTDYVFICAVDMPFVRREMVEYLAKFISSDHDAWVFRDKDRIHPLCGIYSRTVLPVAVKLIGEGSYRMMGLLANIRTQYIDISTGGFFPETLRNINTPEDYRAIRGEC